LSKDAETKKNIRIAFRVKKRSNKRKKQLPPNLRFLAKTSISSRFNDLHKWLPKQLLLNRFSQKRKLYTSTFLPQYLSYYFYLNQPFLNSQKQQAFERLTYVRYKKNFPEFYRKKQTPIQFFDEQFESNFDVLKEKLYYANRFKTLRKDQKQPKEDGKIHLFVIFHYPKVKAPKEDKKDGFSFSFLHNFSSFFRKFDLTKELRLQLGQSRSLRQSQKNLKKRLFRLVLFMH